MTRHAYFGSFSGSNYGAATPESAREALSTLLAYSNFKNREIEIRMPGMQLRWESN